MLKIIGTAEDNQASLELDPHVPFTLRLGVPPAGGSFVWHCDDEQQGKRTSTLEVWVHSRTGAIHDVTLVSMNPARVSQAAEPDGEPTIPTPGRIPICDKADWMREKSWNNPEEPAKRNVFVSRRFELVLGPNFASIRFQDAGEPASWVVNQRSRFGINAGGSMCRIDLINLRPEDLESLREAVEPFEPKS